MICEETPDEEKDIDCPEEKTHCYVMKQKLKTSGDIITWNRSCCTPKDDAPDCPLNKPPHIDNEYYEVWRATCKNDRCNIMDPSLSEEDGGGSISVSGKNKGARTVSGLVGLVMIFVSLAFYI
ncbi:uncharacterized protein LOC111717346 [Eurytemora carolleeae]|uniref:uncharacterized protein LOC111717346 n=1 Tax=Eurytemora carolleeae TaxID=1294199 RepID=UPI000C75619B|nr:uncharacterized protein LOC111717346 [Eurytemora carolleeae]|eukprot:XP_023348618.1 uncharacterized protein LOC111717346 [Eurytemora affinis]